MRPSLRRRLPRQGTDQIEHEEGSPLIGEITGKSSTAAINPTVGYRLYF